jgi:hypothetical protein
MTTVSRLSGQANHIDKWLDQEPINPTDPAAVAKRFCQEEFADHLFCIDRKFCVLDGAARTAIEREELRAKVYRWLDRQCRIDHRIDLGCRVIAKPSLVSGIVCALRFLRYRKAVAR